MNVAVTGSANAVARARTAMAWTAWTRPSPMFQRRNDAACDAGSSTVGVEMSRLVAIKAVFAEREWGLEETGPHPRVACGGLWDQSVGGRMTLSITWMTPFDAITSGVTTLALSFR